MSPAQMLLNNTTTLQQTWDRLWQKNKQNKNGLSNVWNDILQTHKGMFCFVYNLYIKEIIFYF